MENVTIHNICRICGNKRLTPVLHLGAQPPANNFLTKRELSGPETRFPLVVQFCEQCSLLSLRHVVDPRVLFKNYHYETGASARRPALSRRGTDDEDQLRTPVQATLSLSSGSNDGILLSELRAPAECF